jgi:hypothetical protein
VGGGAVLLSVNSGPILLQQTVDREPYVISWIVNLFLNQTMQRNTTNQPTNQPTNQLRSWDSSVSIVTRLRFARNILLFANASITALGTTQPHIQCVPLVLSRGVEWPSREDDRSLPSAEVKNAWSYTSTPSYVFMTWRLFKHRDNFTFYLY